MRFRFIPSHIKLIYQSLKEQELYRAIHHKIYCTRSLTNIYTISSYNHGLRYSGLDTKTMNFTIINLF